MPGSGSGSAVFVDLCVCSICGSSNPWQYMAGSRKNPMVAHFALFAGCCRTHIHFATNPTLLRANSWAHVFLLLKLKVRLGPNSETLMHAVSRPC